MSSASPGSPAAALAMGAATPSRRLHLRARSAKRGRESLSLWRSGAGRPTRVAPRHTWCRSAALKEGRWGHAACRGALGVRSLAFARSPDNARGISAPRRFGARARAPVCGHLVVTFRAYEGYTVANQDTTKTLQLTRLAEGFPCITPAFGTSLAEAACVCLDDRAHPRPVDMRIDGSFEEKYSVRWNSPTDQMRRKQQ